MINRVLSHRISRPRARRRHRLDVLLYFTLLLLLLVFFGFSPASLRTSTMGSRLRSIDQESRVSDDNTVHRLDYSDSW